MSFFTSLKVSGSALVSERLRVDLASANLANANATRSPEGGPYRRRDAVIESVPVSTRFGFDLERAVRQVKVRGIRIDQTAPRQIYNPRHPDSDESGMLRLPNIQIVEEMTNLMNAQRAFEANLSAISTSRTLAERALRIGKTG